jgi:hypothetical protein
MNICGVVPCAAALLGLIAPPALGAKTVSGPTSTGSRGKI